MNTTAPQTESVAINPAATEATETVAVATTPHAIPFPVLRAPVDQTPLPLAADARPSSWFEGSLLPPQPGDRLGSYLLQEQVGAGASCFVFRGLDEEHGKPVALKIMNWANVVDRPAALQQLRTEAASLARVKHPQVVQFLDFGFDNRWPYLATEFIGGQPLSELLRSGGGLPTNWAMYLISQVLDGLGAVWQAGLVHRDLKPANILIGEDGSAKLIDFGLAKAPVVYADDKAGPVLMGTVGYVSPEQARDAGVVDLRADIYSLGVTFYEVLTGRLPFDCKNRMQMIYHHMNTPPVPLTERVPDLHPLISDLCLWMLAKSPNERPQSYDELRESFDTVIGAVAG